MATDNSKPKAPNKGGRPRAQGIGGVKPVPVSISLLPAAREWLEREENYGSVTNAVQSLLPEEFKTIKG